MSVETQSKISQSPTGRIVLHLMTLKRDHKFRWHWVGILREVRTITDALA
jgi:hypothetical protein